MFSSFRGHVEIVDLLLQAGASVNDKDNVLVFDWHFCCFFDLPDFVCFLNVLVWTHGVDACCSTW